MHSYNWLEKWKQTIKSLKKVPVDMTMNRNMQNRLIFIVVSQVTNKSNSVEQVSLLENNYNRYDI